MGVLPDVILFQQVTRRGASDPPVLKPLGLDPLCVQAVTPDDDEEDLGPCAWLTLDGDVQAKVVGSVVEIVNRINGDTCPEQAVIETS